MRRTSCGGSGSDCWIEQAELLSYKQNGQFLVRRTSCGGSGSDCWIEQAELLSYKQNGQFLDEFYSF